MKHRIVSRTCILVLAGMMLASTGWSQQGGVAVVDIDAVAKEIGADKDVLGALRQAQTDLNAKLKETQTAMQKQFDDAVIKAGGDKASDEQKQQLAQFNARLQNQFSQYRGQAQVTLNQAQIKLVTAFREKVRPVALEVAKSKGMSVVLQKSDQIIGFQEQVDITREVAAIMMEKRAAELKAKASAKPEETSSGPEASSSGPEASSSGPEASSSGPEATIIPKSKKATPVSGEKKE